MITTLCLLSKMDAVVYVGDPNVDNNKAELSD